MLKKLRKMLRMETRAEPAEIRAEPLTDSGTITETDVSDVLRGKSAQTTITREEAMNIPAVAGSVHFICNIVASLPIRLYKTEPGGNVVEIQNDHRLQLLNDETGDLLDAVQSKRAILEDMLLEGNGYWYLNKRGNFLESIHYVEAAQVAVNKNADPIFKEADILVNGKKYYDFDFLRITRLSKDGVTGTGVLKENPILLSAMYNSLKYENNTMSRGGRKGFLKSERKLDQKMLDYLKQKWQQFFGNNDADNDVIVLNQGLSFEPASSTATENQLNENKLTNTKQCYGIFGLSEELFVSGSGTTDVFLKAIKTGIKPVVEAFEKALNKFLLLEEEKQCYRFRIDLKDIIRADTLTMYQAYEIALKNGILKLDEVRKAENLPAVDFNFVKLGLDTVLYNPEQKTIYIPNMGEMIDLQTKQIMNMRGKGGEKGGNEN
ncbi:MAG: phage portal protein [Succiniclasticum sp.]|uniref:phage portal protein n=1 Tax=Succiniclasticum sp. TaxID=2775030 RepID=UPI002A90C4EF|nr:phage portal protein [Succiniclasticum sp.]MDY6291705.1 phage portal protein [Succiniclasticum sp.]